MLTFSDVDPVPVCAPTVVQRSQFTTRAVSAAAGPPGTWEAVGTQDGLMHCTAACASKPGMVYVAMLPLREGAFKCWCGKTAGTGALTDVIPQVGGRAQIVNVARIIKEMTVHTSTTYMTHH